MKSTLFVLVCCTLAALFFLKKPPLLEEISFSQAIYDEHHQLLRLTLSSDQKYRLFTSLDEISPLLVEATLLQEDQYFFYHPGCNPIAMIKAAWQTYVLQTRQFGSSTITMQVARMRYGIHSKTVSGKLWQILKAVQLELFYSKAQILEAYLNLASYGGNIEGAGAASLVYFGKSAGKLHLPDALRLSIVPQNPKRRAPNLPHQKEFQNVCNLLFQRWIALHPEDEALRHLTTLPAHITKKHLPFQAPHFVQSVLRTHRQPKVVTTLNMTQQHIIENMIHQYLEQFKAYGIHNASAMLVDTRTMQVKASAGSGNFFDASIHGQVDGTKAKRSPGSTLKPFIYALAMDQGIIHPFTVLKDAPSSYSDYNPENYERDFLGPIKAKDALILSRNIPAIHLASQLKQPTLHQFLQQAHISGLRAEQDYGLSLALGSVEVTMEELVALYSMLANFGIWHPLQTIEQPLTDGIRLLSPEASFLTLEMLSETTRPCSLPIASKELPVHWKTGTSSGYRDAWSVGIFGPYVLAVWIGDFNGKSNPSFVGASAAAPLFFTIVEALSKQMGHLPDLVHQNQDMNLTKVEVCDASGMLPGRCCPRTVSTWFIPGKSPIVTDTVHREIAIDKRTGLRTNRIDQNTEFVVYECWPSDVLRIFAQAGIQRSVPPPFEQGCFPIDNVVGMTPQIIEPKQGIIYSIRLGKNHHEIFFSAAADADAKTLYWFVDHHFIGSSGRDQPIPWHAKPGSYAVRVVDDYGRTATQELTVEAVE